MAQETLDSGHVDAFYVTAPGGQLTLGLKEDVTGSGVVHAPEDVTLRVAEDAWSDATSQVDGIGGPTYFLPQTQDQSLLWPGWDTQPAGAQGFEEVRLHFDKVTGPGSVFVFETSGFGDVDAVTDSGYLDLVDGESITQPYPAHRHVNWAFTDPGTYSMTVRATSNGEESNAATYTWVVGDGSSSGQGAGAGNAGSAGGNGGEPAGDGSDNAGSNDGSGNLSHSGSAGGSRNSGGANGAARGGAASAAGDSNRSAGAARARAGRTGATGGECKPGLELLVKDDTVSPAEWIPAGEATFYLSDAARVDLPQQVGVVPEGEAWMIGSTQQAGVPWLGANTQHPDMREHTTGPVTWDLVDYSGPGVMQVYAQGGLGQIVGEEWFSSSGGAVDIAENTHVHPNWVFSQPGTYKLTIRQTATTADGKLLSGHSRLTFQVGGAQPDGAFTEGHFDLGAKADPAGGDCAPGPSEELSGDAQPATPQVLSASGDGDGTPYMALGLGAMGVGFLVLGIGIGALAWLRGRR